MNHARWKAGFADRRRTTEVNSGTIIHSVDLDKTPDVTRKLLEMDEQQLDLLTGQRANIFKNVPEGESR